MTNEELAISIQQGKREFISELYERVKKLLNCKARDYFNKFYESCSRCGVGLDDLYQEAFFAMLDAVRSFKPDAENKFTAYLSYPVTNHFKALTNCRRGKRNPLNNSYSLDEPLSPENTNITRGDALPDESAQEQFDALESSLVQTALHTAEEKSMGELEPQQREVIQCRYFENLTMQAVGERIGCSREQAQQFQIKALRTLRKPKIARTLSPFLFDELESSAYRGTGLQSFKNAGMSSVERTAEKFYKFN